MSTPMTVSRFETKPFDTPDERRSPEKTQVDVVHLDGVTLGRLTLSPGWRWSTCIKPVVGTAACQVSHAGHAISGQLHVRMADGSEHVIRAGDAYTIPPGHDAWVDGNTPFVCIEVMSADQFARPHAA